MTDTAHTASTVRELPLQPGGLVELLLTANDLRLRGTDDDRVVIRTRGGEDIEEQIDIESEPGVIRIRSGGSGEHRLGPLRMRTQPSAGLDVDVPRAARLSVRTLSGDVSAVGVAGPSRWGTASGDLRLQLLAGPVEADSLSGDISIDGISTIAVAARSVSGDVHIRAPQLEALSATSTSGDIQVEGALGGTSAHTISSVSGDVQLATGSAVQVEAQTVSGDIRAGVAHRAEGGRGRRTLTVGDGHVRVSVRTMSGDIRLREGPFESTTPAHPAGSRDVGNPGISPQQGAEGATDRREAERLDVLQALERGDLDIDTASRRLEAIEAAGPRPFRGRFR